MATHKKGKLEKFASKLEEKVAMVKADNTNLAKVFENTVKKAEKSLDTEIELSEL